jgi:hypothetical protein
MWNRLLFIINGSGHWLTTKPRKGLKMDKQEIIKGLEQGLARLSGIAKLDPKVLQKAYAPGKWTGMQVLSHLADADLVMYVRFLRIVSEESVRLVPFDHDRWVVYLGARASSSEAVGDYS